MNENTFIYSLSYNNIVRYVGKTNNIKERLNEHINESKKSTKTRKARWIKSLLKRGELPTIEIVDTIQENEWPFWETFYINLFRSWGFDLTNMTPGGDGTGQGIYNPNYGKKLTEEHKRKCSIKLAGKNNPFFGKKHSEEILKRFYKPILQYNIDGNFIREWKSIHDAEFTLKIHSVSSCCSGKLLSVHGFIWKYKINENFDKKIIITKTYKKPVYQYTINGEFIRKWNSISEAEREFKIFHISNVCRRKGSYKSAGGYIWKYQ